MDIESLEELFVDLINFNNMVSLKVILAGKKFAKHILGNHQFYFYYRGTIGRWTYIQIKRKGMPRYTGFGSLIRVYKNGRVDREKYFVPQVMWFKTLKDTRKNREWMDRYIASEKVANKRALAFRLKTQK